MNIAFGGGFWLVSLFGFLVVLLFWGLVIAALILGIRWLIRADRRGQVPPPPAATPDPLEVLRHRYANGEIDEEEYDRRRKTLTGS